MRYVLLRYVSRETGWVPRFVLRSLGFYNMKGIWMPTFELVYDEVDNGDAGIHRTLLLFDASQQAFDWVRTKATGGSSVEWEGSSF